MVISINEENLKDETISPSVKSIICRIVDCTKEINSEDELEDEIRKAVDEIVIFDSDRWEIISEYSSPYNPIDIDYAIDLLLIQIKNIIELI